MYEVYKYPLLFWKQLLVCLYKVVHVIYEKSETVLLLLKMTLQYKTEQVLRQVRALLWTEQLCMAVGAGNNRGTVVWSVHEWNSSWNFI